MPIARGVGEATNVKVSVTMPADMLAALKVADFQRRSIGDSDVSVSALVRTAVAEWLEREINGNTSITIQSP